MSRTTHTSTKLRNGSIESGEYQPLNMSLRLVADAAEERVTNQSSIAAAHAGNFAWYQPEEQFTEAAAKVEIALPSNQLVASAQMPGPRRYELGRFALAENHEIIFEAIPQLGEVGYSELVDLSAGQRVPDLDAEELSILHKYIAITNKGIPVPQLLVDLDDEVDEDSVRTLLKGRDLVESPGTIAGVGGSIIASPPTAAAAVNVCGASGADAFEDAYCLNKGIHYCDNGIWYSHVRSSGSSKRKYSHSITGSCQSTAVVHHFYRAYWFGWKWFYVQNPIQQFVPHGSVKYWKYKGAVKRRRKVERYKTNNGDNLNAGFRAWTGFYN